MKKKIVMVVLTGAVIILSGCKSQEFVHGDSVQSMDFVAQDNNDGTITLFSVNNVPVKMDSVTMGGVTGRGIKGFAETNTEDMLIRISNLEAILRANPQDYETCIILAGLYIDRDADQAIKYSNMALAINREKPEALFIRSLASIRQGGPETTAQAISDLHTVMQLNLQSAKGVYYVLGNIYYDNRDIDKAIDAFEIVAILDPEFADVQDMLNSLRK